MNREIENRPAVPETAPPLEKLPLYWRTPVKADVQAFEKAAGHGREVFGVKVFGVRSCFAAKSSGSGLVLQHCRTLRRPANRLANLIEAENASS
jgi:hypothetical protein